MLLTNFDSCHRRASTAGILVIATREDLTIMRETQRLVRLSISRHHECATRFSSNTWLK
jgi:hypothetical protein